MRIPRVKAPIGVDGIYHCFSRAVDGKYIFGKREKNKFLQVMWELADFLDVRILNFTLMNNHYHQIVFVPGVVELTNQQLLLRLKNYYGPESREYRQFLLAIEKGDKSPNMLRPKYMRFMGDLSEFEKRLKHRFSYWYNKLHGRKGALWMERFGSTLTEDCQRATVPMSAYVDLNSVRACLVDDPKDYPYCGYAAALAGDKRCRDGLLRLLHRTDWGDALAYYRKFLMIRGHSEARGKPGKVSRKLLLQTLERNGTLTVSELLRLKIRYFTEGLAIGSGEFVEDLFQQNSSHFGERQKKKPNPIGAAPNLKLSVLKTLKRPIFE